ncbi:hypothetical protein M011DRAFT_466874 [Sporormia fimetaria CBS 119925]|uniref:Uncharacterized protein n=1 Tax=Sporormia fimetaria CBS 119925 TaxID=1340428 RepID=A0A6A6VD06_9PLEO|nr:hypothetical protein M011DRAFT_466874 [Sporormia fimetaria CBS 119925]
MKMKMMKLMKLMRLTFSLAPCNPIGQYQMLLPTDAYTGALQPTAAYCCLVNPQLYRIC